MLVGILALLGYGSRIGEGKPDPDVLYRWSTALGGFIQDAIILALVLAIARGSFSLLALRRPSSLKRAAVYVGCAIAAIYLFESIYASVVDPGNEQGLTPSHWEPAHAAVYIVNSVIICTWVPLVEELTYRGVGYSLLERFGRWPAVLGVGLAFGLAHGLLLSLPIIVVFGCVLAWIREQTNSVFPGMLLHGTFNLVALVAAVTVHR